MAVADYIAAVLADSPAAFWELQDAADFPQDSSGNGKHMDTDIHATGGTTTYGVLFGPASSMRVNLAQSVIARSADPVLTAVNNVTMELWIQGLAPGGSTQPVFWIGGNNVLGNGLGNNSWGIRTNQSGSASPGPFITVGNAGVFSSSTPSTNAAWTSTTTFTSLVIVRRAGTWEMWQNGVQDTSIGTFTAAPGAGATSAAIGYANNSFTQSSRVAFASLYNAALSGTRILAHYNAMRALQPGDYEPFTLATGGDAQYADGAGVSIRG